MKKFYRRKRHILRKLGVALLSIAQTLYLFHLTLNYFDLELNDFDIDYFLFSTILSVIMLTYFTYEFYNVIIEFILQEIQIRKEYEKEDEEYWILKEDEKKFIKETEHTAEIFRLRKTDEGGITIDID